MGDGYGLCDIVDIVLSQPVECGSKRGSGQRCDAIFPGNELGDRDGFRGAVVLAGKTIYGRLNANLASLWTAGNHGTKIVHESLRGESVGVWGDGSHNYWDWFPDDIVGGRVNKNSRNQEL